MLMIKEFKKLSKLSLKPINSFNYISKKFAHEKVCFFGLGNMGLPMALNLQKSGMKVTGFDLNEKLQEEFKNQGGNIAHDMSLSIREADCIITMLPNYLATEMVWTNSFIHAKKRTVFIDNSTISPTDAKEIGNIAKHNDFIAGICPVSGGVNGAKSGNLSFMVGSEKDHFESVKKFLLPMGKNIFHTGDYASGQIVKICNNLCLAISMAGLSESLALGVKLGMDPKILSEVMSASTARSWSLDSYNPVPGILPNAPASRDYDNGYNNELMKKDLLIAEECAKQVGLHTDLGKKVTDYYLALNELGLQKKDFGVIYQYILANKSDKFRNNN